MEHEEARKLFTRYDEGDLSPSEREDLERHLESCAACRAEWDAYRKTVEEVSGLLAVEPPDGFVLSVERKIQRRSRGRFFSQRRSGGPQIAFASLLLVAVFFLAYLLLTAATEIVILDAPGRAGPDAAEEDPADDGGVTSSGRT